MGLKGIKKALCKVCDRTIDLSSMGESALKSHMKCSKHQSAIVARGKQPSLTYYLGSSTNLADKEKQNLNGARAELTAPQTPQTL